MTMSINVHYETPLVNIITLGNQNDSLATQICSRTTKPLQYLVYPPANESETGFCKIYNPNNQTSEIDFNQFLPIKADGIVLPEEGSVAIRSRDCPIVVFMPPAPSRPIVMHVGRAALLGQNSHSIIDNGLQALQTVDISELEVYITAGICQQCFTHKTEKQKKLLRAFRESYPKAIDKNSGLDLLQVISNKLVGCGVKTKNIIHDQLCTRCHPGLASYRCRDSTHNYVLVSEKTL